MAIDTEIIEFRNYLIRHNDEHLEPIKQYEVSLIERGHQLTFDQIRELALDELKTVWSQRPYSFYSVEAACEALSRLRYESQVDDAKKVWSQFLHHPTIIEFDGQLEREFENINALNEIEEMSKDISHKIFGFVKQQLRVGQANFRDLVIDAYDGRCCVTECTELNVVEAAHIRPYTGKHSNTLDNSLLLRADVHKLFDRFLISIEPHEFTVVISKKVTDAYYQKLNGKQLFSSGFKPSSKLIGEHFDTFKRIQLEL